MPTPSRHSNNYNKSFAEKQWQDLLLLLLVCGSNSGLYVGKLVVAYRWLAVNSTEAWPTVYVLVSSTHKNTRRDITCTVLKVM